MPLDKALREHLISSLTDGHAHSGFEAVIHELPPDLRGVQPREGVHSAWELLEHIRIAQWDIVEFVQNASHVSPPFPLGYWPVSPEPPDDEAWEQSARSFRRDFRTLLELLRDEATDLFAPLPHGNGQTLVREALLVLDHTSYHLGELVLLRKILGAWPG